MTQAAGAGRPSIGAGRLAHRLSRARHLALEAGRDALLVGVGADLRYLSGYAPPPLERLTMLVVPAHGRPSLVVPRLEAMAARAIPVVEAETVAVVPWDETDDPFALVAGLVERGAPDGARPPSAVAVSDRLWATFVLHLQEALPTARFSLLSDVLRGERIVKDPDEVDLLRAAAHAADRALEQVAHGRLIGRTEADVSREVRDRLVAEGHDEASFAIVASGPNSASPHHEPADRVIRAGEPIVLDIGGSLGGYGSDITRTLWVTGGEPSRGPDPDFLALYGVLRDAQAAATREVRPGVPAEHIDAVAREIITAAGYGGAFIHRTGHGIGLEEHEDPYLVAGNATPLRAGMAFSIEPGIYLDGRYGARIEDIVVCGEDGPIVLDAVTRDLLVVHG
ncbi:MAG: Xaa-Pro peptidase family protein [Chloroflexi bacterium]|nr:Xaa-Pro peptidase family protein [Chloroflexota bacterium]